MQKLKVLIEENTAGSVHPVEVAADAPIASLVPALVDALQLPHTDLFGKQLVYMLRSPSGGHVFPEHASLIDAGVIPGTRLMLDSYVRDGSVAALERSSSWQPSLPRGVSPDTNVYTSVTLTDPNDFIPETGMQYATAVAPPTPTPMFAPPVPTKQTKGRSTRRAFLIASVAALGIGGVSYAAYQKFSGGNSTATHTAMSTVKTKPTAHVANIPKAPTKQVTKQPAQQPTNALPTTAKTILTFQAHQQIVRTVAWSPGNIQLASGSDDTHVLVWNTLGNVQQTLNHPAPVLTLAWSPEGQRVVTGASNQVAFFNTQTGAIIARSTRQHALAVNSVAWTGQGMMQAVSASADKRAIVWNSQTYQPQIIYAKHTIAILAAAWSNNGQVVATGSQGGLVRVWNAANGQDVHGYFTDAALPMPTLAFAPTGAQLAVGGADGVVRLWNGLTCINNGVHCTDVPQRIQVSQKAVRTLAWSPDGRMLVVGTDDGLLSLFAPAQQQQHLFTLQQQASIQSLAWSPDSKQLALAVGNTVLLMMLM
jgi:WD40 repeat protein